MSVIIKDIKKNNKEIIRLEVSEFKGIDLINLRIWYSSIDNNSGDIIYKPTQKGITININEFDELKDGIDRLETYIKDQKAGTKPEQPEESNDSSDSDESEESE